MWRESRRECCQDGELRPLGHITNFATNEEDCLRSRAAISQTIPLNEAAGQGGGLWGLWPGRNGRGRLAWVGGGRCRDDDGRVLRAVEDREEGDEGRPRGAREGDRGG